MIKELFGWKTWLTAIIIGAVIFIAILAYILIARPGDPSSGNAFSTAALTIIPAPTGTPHTLPPTLTPVPPTPTYPPTLAPDEFGIGAYVQINNTGEEGLNIRSEPGLSGPVIFSGFDSEVFSIRDGPREVDGYVWWYLSASYDESRSGWAAQDFIIVIPAP